MRILMSIPTALALLVIPSTGVAADIVVGDGDSLADAVSAADLADVIVLQVGYDAGSEATVDIRKQVEIQLQDPTKDVQLPELDIQVSGTDTVTIGDTSSSGQLELACSPDSGSSAIEPINWVGTTSGGTPKLILNNLRMPDSCTKYTPAAPVMAISGGDVTLDGLDLDLHGAAVFSVSADLTIRNTRFGNAPGSVDSGGLLFVDPSQTKALLIEDTIFDGTAAAGMIIASADSVTINRSQFLDILGVDGAAIQVRDTANTIISEVVVDGADASGTGVINWEGTGSDDVLISKLDMRHTASTDGAALYLDRVTDSNGTSRVESSFFCDNRTDVGLADVWVKDKAFVSEGNAFVRRGGSANSVWLEGYAFGVHDFVNNTFAGYTSGRAIQLFDNSSTVTVINNAFVDVKTPVHDGTSTGTSLFGGYNATFNTDPININITDNLVTAAPLFVNYSTSLTCEDTLLWLQAETLLQPGSPLRDAGDPASAFNDLDGTRSDIGAYGGPAADLNDGDLDGWFEDLDCDDTDSAVKPGVAEVWYDDVDQDCDGANDFDQDGDGYVRSGSFGEVGGTALLTGDCDDTDASINPGATEVWYNGVDQDCSGGSDYDQDGDGFDSPADCTDTPAGIATIPGDQIYPGATDTFYDGIDQDCAGDNDHDADGDGYVDPAYNSLAGGTAPGMDDCDDTVATTYPTAPEVWYDDVDANCLGDNDFDQDGDGYVRLGDDTKVGGTAVQNGDCDDDPTDDASAAVAAADVNPDSTDVWYDGVDQDCAGNNDWDKDGDGSECDGDLSGTECPGHSGDDCVDDPAGAMTEQGTTILGEQINPSATDVWYDGVDQDCNGWNDFDQDLDGEECNGGSEADPFCPDDHVGTDCVDDPAGEAGIPGVEINSSATETWYDGYDQNCDGADDYDQDGDGHQSEDVTGGDDCDDENGNVFPGAPEVPGDSVDQDCDGEDALGNGETDTDTGDTDGGCGCATNGGGAGWLLVMLAGVMVRRRRSS